MRMRYGMGAVIALLVVALAVCAGLSRKSKRSMAPSVAKLIGALVMPVTGNLIIILSSDHPGFKGQDGGHFSEHRR